jgi:divalent metal cation (Fe/Co/Zn/Cd) transporter
MALEGDARHLITDVWTSAGVVLGLALVMFTGWHWVDPAVAIVMALNILGEGGQLIWRSAQGLMDAAVEPEVQARSTPWWTASCRRRPARPACAWTMR